MKHFTQHAVPWCRSWRQVAEECCIRSQRCTVSGGQIPLAAIQRLIDDSMGQQPIFSTRICRRAAPQASLVFRQRSAAVSSTTVPIRGTSVNDAVHACASGGDACDDDLDDILQVLENAQEALALSQANILVQVLRVVEQTDSSISRSAGRIQQVAQQDEPPPAQEGEVDPLGLWDALCGNPKQGVPGSVLRTILESVEPQFSGCQALIDVPFPVAVHAGDDSPPKIVIVGDTHGQLNDVLWIFFRHGPPCGNTTYIFNGDIADRGTNAVEIFALVLAFKAAYPDRVFLLRGNHEHSTMNDRPFKMGGGFKAECMEKHGQWIYNRFQALFSKLPLFAVVADEVFVVHAGLPRVPVGLQQLRELELMDHFPAPRSKDDIKKGVPSSWDERDTIVFDAQWADPHEGKGCTPSKRGGDAIRFGTDITASFLKDSGLKLLVRSHEVAPRKSKKERPPGHMWAQGRRLLTVFSASNYGGVYQNLGTVAVFQKHPFGDPHAGTFPVGQMALRLDSYYAPTLEKIAAAVLQGRSHKASLDKVLGARSPPKRGSSLDSTQGPNLLAEPLVPEELLHYALGILCVHRERLWSYCHERAAQGRVAIEDLTEELGHLSHGPGLPWSWLLKDEELGLAQSFRTPDGRVFTEQTSVNYGFLLSRFHVHWPILLKFDMSKAVNQLNELMDKVLFAELSLKEAKALFDMDSDGDISLLECHSVLRRLVPALSDRQVHEILHMMDKAVWAGQTAIPVERFLAALYLYFGHRVPPTHPFLKEMMPKMMSLWSNTPLNGEADLVNFGEQIFREFQVMDTDDSGFLDKDELKHHLHEILPMAQLGFGTDHEECLFQYLDETGNGDISAFELFRGAVGAVSHLLKGEKITSATLPASLAEDMLCSFNALLNSQRPVLLSTCHKVDERLFNKCTGELPRESFMAVVRALLEVLPDGEVPPGRFEMQLEALQTVLPKAVRYDELLGSFEIIDSCGQVQSDSYLEL